VENLKDIMESINKTLDSTWSKKQLALGKWFEIRSEWDRKIVKNLIKQYESAGWAVVRRAELSRKGTKLFLVIAHPKFFTDRV
jgi:hypothetical protein